MSAVEPSAPCLRQARIHLTGVSVFEGHSGHCAAYLLVVYWGWRRRLSVTLPEIPDINWTILYSIYGQVCFITGLAAGLHWRRQRRIDLDRPLPWLAAFGIAHGLNEWGCLFIPVQAMYLEEAVVRLMVIAHLLLLAVSFFFLLQFGVALALPRLPRHRWLPRLSSVASNEAAAPQRTLSTSWTCSSNTM